MKYVTAMALGAAFALASCVSKGTVVRVEDQRDSLVSVVSAKDSLINAVFEDINAISENLVLIKTRENLISVAGGSDVEETTLLCQAGGDVADGSIGINIVVEEIDEIFLTKDGAGLP